jgi:hypothetical protein
MFNFFKNLFQKPANPPKKTHKQVDSRQKYFDMKVTDLVLLAEFIKAKSRKKITSDWQDFLNDSPQKVIDELISKDFLIHSSISSCLDLTYKVTDLKLLLKERGLVVSGKKDVLIERLIEADFQGMQSIVANDIYECSPNGRNLVEKYKAEKEIEKNKVVNDALDFILSKNIKKACQIATDYQKQEVVYISKRQQSVSIQPSVETNIEFIEVIVNASPKILRGMSEKDLKNLRLWAALNFLFGLNKKGEELIEDFVGVPKFEPNISKNMMIFFAYRQRDFLKMKKAGLKKASIISCRGCPEIAAIADKIMPINKLPELPYEKCTFIMGCCCSLMPSFDFED